MSVSPVITFPPSADSQAAQGGVRFPSAPQPVPGSDSGREIGGPQINGSASAPEQDVVKVQLKPPGAIAVYQFVNQQGTLILQVPPQQLLNLAADIAQELAAETSSKAAAETAERSAEGSAGGNNNAH